MNRMLIPTALGAFGFGALLSWAITADFYESRIKFEEAGYDTLLRDKTEHIWALQDRIAYIKGEDWKTELDPNQATIDEIDGVVEEDPIPENETPEETRSNLQALIDRYSSGRDDQIEELNNFVGRVVEHENSPPFVISRENYAYDEEGESYSKITLEYYPRDRVLLDDEEDPVDVLKLVGWNNLKRFGDESGDPNVVFVRNRYLETDFEVVKDDESELPKHVIYGMQKDEFEINKAAGLIRLPREEQ